MFGTPPSSVSSFFSSIKDNIIAGMELQRNANSAIRILPLENATYEDDKQYALNFVSTWHTNLVALAFTVPVVASIAVSIAWPAVAVLHYGADLQTSVQTGVTIGGFVVTAGAVFIAMITFSTSVQDSNGKYAEYLQGRTEARA